MDTEYSSNEEGLKIKGVRHCLQIQDEKYSNMLDWLLDPNENHGFGC